MATRVLLKVDTTERVWAVNHVALWVRLTTMIIMA